MKSEKKLNVSPQKKPVFQYSVFENKHFDEALNLIAKTFSQGEPMTSYLGISEQEFADFAKPMIEKTVACGLGIVALDANNVVACTAVEDMADPAHIDISKLTPKFAPILGVLETLGDRFFAGKQFNKNHLAHLFMTAVDPAYQGNGLSKEINLRSIEQAKNKNYDFMCCEFTSAINEKGTVKHLKNNFKLFQSCVYKDFVFDDKKPFEKLEGCANAYIWALRNNVDLQYTNEKHESLVMKI